MGLRWSLSRKSLDTFSIFFRLIVVITKSSKKRKDNEKIGKDL